MKKTAASSMRLFVPILFIFTVSLSLSANGMEETYTAKPGPHQVDTLLCEWNDSTRDREVPVKIYFPLEGEGPFPIIIFSHGLGGSREGYGYLGRHWASYGYVSVHLQHHGSDVAIWRNTFQAFDETRKSIKHIGNAVNRARDVSFAIDQMETMNRESGPLKGRIDLNNIGMAGHSFGAWTTLAVTGQAFIDPKDGEKTFTDPRIKAAIAMSAPAPMKIDRLDKTFANIKIPCLHMTGTLDDSPLGDTKANQRRLPFDNIQAADQYLITFEGGDHMIFTGLPNRLGSHEKDPCFHDLVKISSTSFWDAHLKNNSAAKKWLADGGLNTLLGQDGSLEKKEKTSLSD